MEAEYAFRHEVLERTGMVILDTKHAPTTELRMLPSVPGGQSGALPPAVDVDASAALPPSEGDAAQEDPSQTAVDIDGGKK